MKLEFDSPVAAQLAIAVLTLANTVIAAWAATRVRKVSKQLNGMREELELAARGEGFREGRAETVAEIEERSAATLREALRRGRERMSKLNPEGRREGPPLPPDD